MNNRQYEREEEAIMKSHADGIISHAEMMKELRDLARDYRSAAEESARNAYDRELDNW